MNYFQNEFAKVHKITIFSFSLTTYFFHKKMIVTTQRHKKNTYFCTLVFPFLLFSDQFRNERIKKQH